MLLSLQEKSASAGRKLIVSCIKKYVSKQHIQEIVTGWSILVGGPGHRYRSRQGCKLDVSHSASQQEELHLFFYAQSVC